MSKDRKTHFDFIKNAPSRLSNSAIQKTPNKIGRSHRIFRDSDENFLSNSPSKKMDASQKSTEINGNINSSYIKFQYQQPQGCTLYYNEGSGLSTKQPIIYQPPLTPQKLGFSKSNQILQYQISVLRKQLQDRDNVIHLYKKGWNPNTQPINEGLIKNLNLQLTQKCVLIQQVHRSLAQFQQQIMNENIQISPFCLQRFRFLQQLILKHEHYPILITEKIFDAPVKVTEQVVIREKSNSYEEQIRMEQFYSEFHSNKDRLMEFERQNQMLKETLAGLQTQNINQIKQIQYLDKQILIFQQQINIYKLEIKTLNTTITQLQSKFQQQSQQKKINIQYEQMISQLKLQKIKLQQKIDLLNYNSNQKQLRELNAKISNYQIQIDTMKWKQSQLTKQLQRFRTAPKRQEWQLKIQQIKTKYQVRLSDIDMKYQTSLRKIKQLQKDNKIYLAQVTKWKNHLDEAENYIQQLLKEIQGLKKQIELNKMEIPDHKTIEENNRLHSEVDKLLAEVERLKNLSDNLRTQYNTTNATVKQYKIQINQFQSRIQSLKREKEDEAIKWQNQIDDSIKQYKFKISELQMKISRLLKEKQDQAAKWQQKLNTSVKNSSIQINEYQIQIKNIIREKQTEATKWKNKLHENNEEHLKTISALQVEIEELKRQLANSEKNKGVQEKLRQQIKRLSTQIETLNAEIMNYNTHFNEVKTQYEQQITELQAQINEYMKKIEEYQQEKSKEQWQKEIQSITNDYELKLKQAYDKLHELQISLQQRSNEYLIQIQTLQTKNKQLLDQMQKYKTVSEEYFYKIDSRYDEVRKILISLSTRNAKYIKTESQYWQTYREKRKKDLQQMQTTINESLSIIGNVDQTMILTKNELYSLDLTRLEELLQQINELKEGKMQIQHSTKELIESKFYGALKSVSTTMTKTDY